jgi:prepilin-type N-terminal cleavage/methylation domain-containing protein
MRTDHRRRRVRRERGFSLIESLIALAIASAVMTAYFQSLSASLLLDRRSKAQANAALIAANLLDQVGAEIAVEPQVLEGLAPGVGQYTLTITPGTGALEVESGIIGYGGDKIATVAIVIDGPELPGGYRLTSLRLTNGTLR